MKRLTLRLSPLAALICVTLHAADAPTTSDFGGAGLWQTPTARMADEGELSLTASRTSPYTRYNVTLQPLPWLETIFRYVAVDNRLYGPASLSGGQSYKDKSIDFKLRIWEESHYLPDVSVGARDIGGTGLFSGEYVAASKRFGPFDVSLGLGWGYVGNRGNISNPLGVLDDRFRTRPGRGATTGGEFNSNNYFRGPMAAFGGVSWQTPWKKLVVKVEYEGNDYKHEPLKNNQPQRTPVNLGAVYRASSAVDLSLALERGRAIMAGFTFHTNLAQYVPPVKIFDPPVPERHPANLAPEQVDWKSVSKELRDNAGFQVTRVSRRGSELIVTAAQTRYFYKAKGIGRAARVLDNQLDGTINWFTVLTDRHDVPIVETSISRKSFNELVDQRIDVETFRRGTQRTPPMPQREEVLFTDPPERWDGAFGIGYGQMLGGPDAFVLYQIYANYDADFQITKHTWWSGAIYANLLNNYDRFKYDAPSNLPRVRTDIRQYVTSSRFTLPVFQVTHVERLDTDLYGMVYGGMLESMYGGAGGEVLYRPTGEHYAIGLDANWVKQRDYDQDFGFRRYHVATGHLTGYLDTGFHDVTVSASVGRYLAGDIGVTLDLSRGFANGVRMGAWATKTNVSARQFGEGSFDKGIYFSVPFDFLTQRSSPGRANVVWQPLFRDGGARLGRRYSLYSLTDERDGDNFEKNLSRISE
ncbi:YjbH domain-containing protein [Bacillus sp. NP157]|nr:YjbH domain-containing protein [Bacillus sp. NP157]